MALDPTISLNVAGGGGPAAPGLPSPSGLAANPLGLITGLAGLQRTEAETANLRAQQANIQNQNQQFQASFAARRKAGQIIASAPDLATGLSAIQADPDVMGYAPQVPTEIKNLINAGLTSQQITSQIGLTRAETSRANSETARTNLLAPLQAGEISANVTRTQAGMGNDVASSLISALGSAANDPSKIPAVVNAHLSMLPPGVRAQALPGIQGVVQSILPTELTPGTPEYTAKYNQNLVALVTGSGMDPSKFYTGAGAIPPYAATGPNASGATVTGQPAGGFGPSPIGTAAVGPALVGPGAQEGKYLESSGGQMADIQAEMSQRAAAMPAAVNRLNMITGALGNFQAGGGAELRTGMSKFIQAVRNVDPDLVSDETVNAIGNKSLPDTQVFNAQVKPLMVSALKEAAQGTGRVMRSEVDAFLESMDSTTDPRAIIRLANQARLGLQIGYDQATKFPEYKALLASKDPSVAGHDLSDFNSWYAKNYSPSKLPAANAAGGMSFSPTPEAAAKGGAPSGPTRRWTPNGIVPIESGSGGAGP